MLTVNASNMDRVYFGSTGDHGLDPVGNAFRQIVATFDEGFADCVRSGDTPAQAARRIGLTTIADHLPDERSMT